MSEQDHLRWGSGQWAETLRGYLKTAGLDDSIIPLLPIKELGSYAERLAPSWCITSHAAETPIAPRLLASISASLCPVMLCAFDISV